MRARGEKKKGGEEGEDLISKWRRGGKRGAWRETGKPWREKKNWAAFVLVCIGGGA